MPSRINIGPENGPYVGINEENGNLQLEDNSGNVVAEWDETNAQWDFANNTLANVDALNSNSVNTGEAKIKSFNGFGEFAGEFDDIPSAFDAAGENGRVILPNDTYTETETGQIVDGFTDGMTVEGESRRGVKLNFDGRFNLLGSGEDITLKNVTMSGVSGSGLIQLRGDDRQKLENCTFILEEGSEAEGSEWVLRLRDGEGYEVNNCTIIAEDEALNRVIRFRGVNQSAINNCRIIHEGDGEAILLDVSTENTSVMSCRIRGSIADSGTNNNVPSNGEGNVIQTN